MKQITDPNLDSQNEALVRDIPGTQTISVTSLEVRKVRKSLALTVENFGLLLGVSPSSIFRYENIGVNAFHQGPVARKLCLLACWVDGEGKIATLRGLLGAKGGLAILAGLLETGSVLTSNLPFEAYAVGRDGLGPDASRLPSVDSLAESILKAFHNADSPLTEAKREPSLNADDMASQIEAEARVMEAEARKLEAQARKLEALARIKSAESVSGA
ncbi:MAG: hypothetical protein LBU69_04980 [Deltaproteobacteria bacterium]|jgi:transcriptional regulator with XRE-family HTH domain|nr:hypothetical protein [Deltaproteobacteria bacterium]